MHTLAHDVSEANLKDNNTKIYITLTMFFEMIHLF